MIVTVNHIKIHTASNGNKTIVIVLLCKTEK